MNFFKISKIFLLLPILGIALVTNSTIFPFIVGKYVLFRLSVDFAFITFLFGLLFHNSAGAVLQSAKRVFTQPLVIAVSVFVAVFLLAVLFAFDPLMALWSNFERGEGGLQILHLWLFFVLLVTLFREKKDWRIIFWCAIAGGVLSGIYGVLAGFNFSNFIGVRFTDPGFRFQGSIGNPAYVAAYAIFLLFYVLYLFASVHRKNPTSLRTIILYVVGIAFLIMFFSAATRGAFLGFIVAVIAFLSYVMYSRAPLRKWFFIVGIVFIIAVGSLIYFQNSNFVKSIPGSRNFDISLGAETFQHRTIRWGIAIDGWRERPLLGWGPENYLNIFDRHFDTKYFVPEKGFGAWFDRAHSIYFDYLAETGILGLLSFLSIFVVFYWQFIKFNRKQEFLDNQAGYASLFERGLIFSILFAYLIQGLVLFDVYTIYINLYLFLAFSVFKFQETAEVRKH